RGILPPLRVVSFELESPKLSSSPTAISTKKLSTEPSGQPGSALHGPVLTGRPEPLGASIDADTGAINFAVFSSSATAVRLVLFTEADLTAGRATLEVPLDPTTNRTGDVWHVMLPNLRDDLLYGYRVDGLHQDTDKEGPGHRHDQSHVVLDPYAVAVLSRRRWGQLGPNLPYGEPGVLGLMPTWPQAAAALPSGRYSSSSFSHQPHFDWEGDRPLNLPMESLVIYEAHVRGFTAHESSGVGAPGTYAGMIEKLDHLQALGINAIELLPVFEFNELEYYSQIPGSKEYRYNFWGYSTVNYFSPMGRYSAALAEGRPVRSTCDEFKQLVKECHKRGIEVLLDVVFNHTAEGNERGPTLSFRGLDNRVYYMLAPGGEYYNYSGCGNTLNCNQPVVRQFILDCLRYWVTEYHVDGFRFDLASILTRAPSAWHPQQYDEETGQPVAMSSGGALVSAEGIMTDGAGVPTGTPLPDPPLVEAISEDPVLRNTKLVAEAWDCDGLNQVGAFPHYGGRWSEWNGKFRDVVRNFIKGTDGPWAGDFASAVCGSPNIYASSQPQESDWWGNNGGRQWRGGRGPSASINFVTAHDGFTLADVVSYNNKHNEANGEDNRDGEAHNNSWNCGEEGPTSKWEVNRLRQRQMRNMSAALLLSCGVPMITMGDEYGHSKGGNNNTYCHDSELNYVRFDFLAFCTPRFVSQYFLCLLLSASRRFPVLPSCPAFTQLPHQPDWSETSRLVAFTLSDGKGGGLYVAFNTSHMPRLLKLPNWAGRLWQPLLDTSKVAPYDFLAADGVLSVADVAAARRSMSMWTADHTYPVLPWSCIVLVSAPEDPTSTNMIR
ncbi:1,4-alpha-glucan branching enzyme II, isoamylase, partial [Volvox carteri f. nagariensis]